MAKIKSANILRIVDIDYSQLQKCTLDFFKEEAEPTYRDCILKEHIYNIESLFENLSDSRDRHTPVMEDIETLLELVNKKKASYLRIVFS